MKNDEKKSINLGFLGIALIGVGFLLVPFNTGFLSFIKKALFVVGYILCMASAVRTLIGRRAEFVDFFSGILSDSRFIWLFVFQVIGGLIACVVFDGSYFILFFAGACSGTLAWWLFAKK